MPYDPQYNRWYGANGGTGTYYHGDIVGVEFHTYKFGVFPPEAHMQNVPCAVCYADHRPTLLMIPARRECPADWNKEYEGISCLSFI